MEPLNDANVPHPPTTTPRAALVPAADARPPLQAIFEFKGLFHVMMQAGGGNWTHGVSSSAAGPWFTESDALDRATKSQFPWDSREGPCDGTASFPNLGRGPYNGSTPVIMYGPDCGHGLSPPPPQPSLGRAALGDAPRVELALPKDPSDPMLRDWVKQTPGPVVFEGTPCSFPG